MRKIFQRTIYTAPISQLRTKIENSRVSVAICRKKLMTTLFYYFNWQWNGFEFIWSMYSVWWSVVHLKIHCVGGAKANLVSVSIENLNQTLFIANNLSCKITSLNNFSISKFAWKYILLIVCFYTYAFDLAYNSIWCKYSDIIYTDRLLSAFSLVFSLSFLYFSARRLSILSLILCSWKILLH